MKFIAIGIIAVAGVSLVACSPNSPAQQKVVFEVRSLGTNGPGNTTVSYTPDGINTFDVGEIDDNWSITLDDNVYASVTFTTGVGTLAECHTYRQSVETDMQTVGENSWQQCRND